MVTMAQRIEALRDEAGLLACLEAALNPATTDYLFYVARGDGSHVFTRTYAEHLQAIRSVRGGR